VSEAAIMPSGAERRLKAFKRQVEQVLPGQVTEVRLFGSRARGDATRESDYDIAVFIRDLAQHADVPTLLSDAAYPHVLEGYAIRPIGLPDDYLSPKAGHPTELAEEISRHSVVIR